MAASSRKIFDQYLKSLLDEVYTAGVDEILEVHTQPDLHEIISLGSNPVKAAGRFLAHHPQGDRTFSFEIDFTDWSICVKNLTGMEDEE